MRTFYCSICDKDFSLSDKARHFETKTHISYSYAIVERKKVENLKIIDIDDNVSDLVWKFTERFYRFTYLSGICSREIRSFPRDLLIRKYYYHLHDVVDMIITFISC